MILTPFFQKYMSTMLLALATENWAVVRALIELALVVVLASMEQVGLYYGPRVA